MMIDYKILKLNIKLILSALLLSSQSKYKLPENMYTLNIPNKKSIQEYANSNIVYYKLFKHIMKNKNILQQLTLLMQDKSYSTMELSPNKHWYVFDAIFNILPDVKISFPLYRGMASRQDLLSCNIGDIYYPQLYWSFSEDENIAQLYIDSFGDNSESIFITLKNAHNIFDYYNFMTYAHTLLFMILGPVKYNSLKLGKYDWSVYDFIQYFSTEKLYITNIDCKYKIVDISEDEDITLILMLMV